MEMVLQFQVRYLKKWNPFLHCIWPRLRKPITRTEVSKAVHSYQYCKQPILNLEASGIVPRSLHIRRIAYMVAYPGQNPIEIAINEYQPHQVVVDGHHRIAAAVFRGDGTVSTKLLGPAESLESFLRGFKCPMISSSV